MSLKRLVEPGSIAVLGASERSAPSLRLLQSLERLGFDGAVYPVNPNRSDIQGRACYATLADCPTVPDVVAVCVRPRNVLDLFGTFAQQGVGAAVVYSGGFAEQGQDGLALQRQVADLCREAGIALCGPNCMGILNPAARSTTYLSEVRDPARLSGRVGLISQSGSIANGMLADVRRFGFSLVASTGNEAVVTTADLMDYLIDDPRTAVIATFTETVREPERYVAALDRAAERGKPVVVLKVGRSLRAKAAITSHTGGLSGEAEVFSAVLKRHRAIEVRDMAEFAEAIAACGGRVKPEGRRLAVVTGSGGQAELLLDVAAEIGVDLPPLPAAERDAIEQVVGPLTGDGNPLDAWGNGDWATNFPHVASVLQASHAYDAVVYCADYHEGQPMVGNDRLLDDARTFVDLASASDKPHYLLNTRPGVLHGGQVELLAGAGIPQLGGVRQGLGAIDALARALAPEAAPRVPKRPPKWPTRPLLADRRNADVLDEADAKQLFAAYGLPTARERLVGTLDEARHAAEAIGYPVVLKVMARNVLHKSDLGLVAVDLADDRALRAAWSDLQDRAARAAPPLEVRGVLV